MRSYNIITPDCISPKPNQSEEAVAELLAQHFDSDISFIKRGSHTTPDIKVIKTGEFWEIKNIRGNGKHTMEDNLRKASKQSSNVVISLLQNPKMTPAKAASKIRFVLENANIPIDHVLLITKSRKIIAIC